MYFSAPPSIMEALARPTAAQRSPGQPADRVIRAGWLRLPEYRTSTNSVAADVAGADVALLEHRDVGDAVLAGEVVGGGEAVRAAADDHDVVGVPELGPRLRHPALAEDVTHRPHP